MMNNRCSRAAGRLTASLGHKAVWLSASGKPICKNNLCARWSVTLYGHSNDCECELTEIMYVLYLDYSD